MQIESGADYIQIAWKDSGFSAQWSNLGEIPFQMYAYNWYQSCVVQEPSRFAILILSKCTSLLAQRTFQCSSHLLHQVTSSSGPVEKSVKVYLSKALECFDCPLYEQILHLVSSTGKERIFVRSKSRFFTLLVLPRISSQSWKNWMFVSWTHEPHSRRVSINHD